LIRLIIALGIIGVFGFIFFKVFQYLIRLSGGSKSRIEKDKKELKQLTFGYEDDLVPISNEELSLLSSKVETEKVEQGVFYTERGVLNSIYEEPIVSYSFRDYGDGKSVLIASTKESNYEFVEREGVVDMRINGFLQGHIQNDSSLVGVEGELIASIENDKRSEYRSLNIREKKVAELLNPTSETAENNTRVFLELKPLDQVEQNILLGMTIYNTLIKT